MVASRAGAGALTLEGERTLKKRAERATGAESGSGMTAKPRQLKMPLLEKMESLKISRVGVESDSDPPDDGDWTYVPWENSA